MTVSNTLAYFGMAKMLMKIGLLYWPQVNFTKNNTGKGVALIRGTKVPLGGTWLTHNINFTEKRLDKGVTLIRVTKVPLGVLG